MAYQWLKTAYPGVRYRKHPKRKHGIKLDQYFTIRYQQNGKRQEEALGWASEGMTAEKANARLAELKEAARTGNGAQSLREKRELENKRRAAEEREEAEQKRAAITFRQFFEDIYSPQCKIDKSHGTWVTEVNLFKHWIAPVIGDLPFAQIGIDHLEKIKGNMLAGKRVRSKKNKRDKNKEAKDAQERRTPAKPLAAQTIYHAMAVIRQAWNRASASNPPLAVGDWPGASKQFRKPKVDNQRKRFLTKNETSTLLTALKLRSQDMHDMALLALHCGLRAGEIFGLTWDKVNLPKGELLLTDTKNGESRISYLTDQTLAMLRQRSMDCQHPRYVFIATNGKQRKYVPTTFAKTVKELGLNEGVTDNRDKIVFHSLRHTYASFLVENGASLPIVRDLLGHKNLIMTSRYSHVSAEAQKSAVAALNKAMQPTGDNIISLKEAKQKKN